MLKLGMILGLLFVFALSGCAPAPGPSWADFERQLHEMPVTSIPTYSLFFYWTPECPYCQRMLEDINRIRVIGYFDALEVQLVGFQVGGGTLVEDIGFWNLAGKLPRGALGTPYVVVWDHTVSPSREVAHFYYMPVEMWVGLLGTVLPWEPGK